jgi:CheY-like chemotaxis protein
LKNDCSANSLARQFWRGATVIDFELTSNNKQLVDDLSAFQRSTTADEKLRGATFSVNATSILIVEDDELVAGMLKEMLEVQGWHVDRCAAGNEALEKIVGKKEYDLLLLDYDLPEINGIELVHRARKLRHRSTTPIIMLSATPLSAAAREAGADVFLHAPRYRIARSDHCGTYLITAQWEIRLDGIVIFHQQGHSPVANVSRMVLRPRISGEDAGGIFHSVESFE